MKLKTLIFLIVFGFCMPLSLPVSADELDVKMEALCNEGNSTACFKRAEKLRTLDRDNKNALEFYIKACDGGYMTGCNHAGILTQMKGAQYSKYWKEAAKMYEKACEADEDQACFNLGTLKYREGRSSKAKKYYKISCDMGNRVACHNLEKLKR